MGKYCEICEKGTLNGNNVSHSNRRMQEKRINGTKPRFRCPN